MSRIVSNGAWGCGIPKRIPMALTQKREPVWKPALFLHEGVSAVAITGVDAFLKPVENFTFKPANPVVA
jgi:hypothetical protein